MHTKKIKSQFYETNISAEEEEASKNPRIFGPHEDHRRTKNGETPPHQRKKETRSLTDAYTMVPKKHRLSKERFNAVYTNGVVLRSKHFVIRASAHPKDLHLAVVASKKVAPSAVKRNALRRKVFGALSECVARGAIVHGEYVFLVLTPALPHKKELCEEIISTLAARSGGGA